MPIDTVFTRRSRTLSTRSVAALTVGFSAVLSVLLFTLPAIGAADRWIQTFKARNAPIIWRQSIEGRIEIYGKVRAGVNLREKIVTDSEWDVPCVSAPVIATSDAKGSFYAPAEKRWRWRSSGAIEQRLLCVESDGLEIYSRINFLVEPEWQVRKMLCSYPMPRTGHPDDSVCVFSLDWPDEPTRF